MICLYFYFCFMMTNKYFAVPLTNYIYIADLHLIQFELVLFLEKYSSHMYIMKNAKKK